MIVTRLSYGITVQRKQYEPIRLDIDVVPDEGQTASAAMDEAIAFADEKIRRAISGDEPPTKKPDYKSPAKSGPAHPNGKGDRGHDPLPKTNDAARVADADFTVPATKTATGDSRGLSGKGNEKAPFDGEGKVETPTKPKRGRPKKKPDYEKELAYTLESETLGELADRFENLRKFAKCFSIEGWKTAVTHVANRYKELNHPTASQETQNRIIEAGKAERTYIANALLAANESVAA